MVSGLNFLILCSLCSVNHSRRSLFLAGIIASQAAVQVVAGPRIGCDAPKYDFGSLIGSEKITHEFVLWNRGSSPVKIAKIKNCCGVTSSITPMVILPGSNAVCKAVFTTRNRYGKQDKQILIASNDRRRLYFEFFFKPLRAFKSAIFPRICIAERRGVASFSG